MKKIKNKLIIFTKYPVPGKVKTRLIPALGAEKACQIHQALVDLTFKEVKTFLKKFSVLLEIHFSGTDHDNMRNWLGQSLNFVKQRTGDLGERMEHAFANSFSQGFENVVMIGTDCAELKSALLHEAFQRLGESDLVLGPAADGGYYLIGLSKYMPQLFQNKSWSTRHLLRETLETGQEIGCSHQLLCQLHDIDFPEDLRRCRHLLKGNRTFNGNL